VFHKILIANRGVIACRVLRTLKRMGIGSVAIYTKADRHSLNVLQADEAVALDTNYLDIERVLAAAKQSGAEAIHPGYGFLSENADFAEACEREGIAFLGPTAAQMRAFGLKHTARALARENAVPLLPGTGLLNGAHEALEAARRVGLPVMLKGTAGGGGIGMRLCRTDEEVLEAWASVERTSRASFRDAGIFAEKYVENARHIEVQIFGDGRGNVLELGERDCSVQRRNQKVIEETPAPGLEAGVRNRMLESAFTLARAVQYRSAGTVEFVYDVDTREFCFLEVNTRLQVEHGVTEEVTGVDLVEWMIRIGAGESLPAKPGAAGFAIQARIYAEDAGNDFRPCAGLVTEATFAPGVRTETWIEAGTEVTPFYDPLLAKIIASGETRAQALANLRNALQNTRIRGIETNTDYLRYVVERNEFAVGGITTGFLNRIPRSVQGIDVIDGGTLTTVQDLPGRLGYWNVGVPPSGPMDDLSFRLGNRLLGNSDGAPGLECTVSGPVLRFRQSATIALTGADFGATLGGGPADRWKPILVQAGDELHLGACEGPGARAYILLQGGLDVGKYLASTSTFTLGKFGGHAGRGLRAGDVLHISHGEPTHPVECPDPLESTPPKFTNDWQIGVFYGPHGAPDFFTPRDIQQFFSAEWKVHYNSSRTGVRLIGHKPEWARHDGGEAGLHPSNIHDNAYAIGAIDFTGDMPVILGPDGPSLGGFVCPAVVAHDELWKTGQLRPGDSVRFVRRDTADAVVHRGSPDIVCRASGDRYLLIEFGEPVLDLNLRFRVQQWLQWLEAHQPRGIIDVTPGIRSLQIHYDSGILSRAEVLQLVDRAESDLSGREDLEIDSRIVHLPLSWDDPATRLAIEKYMKSVRADAPWCPDNIEFIRRINGVETREEVKLIVFDASYLVLGLGDVYLGAPVATPLDPRHRLVTTKYNPARTWTAENSVGIGGAYLCVYGMEGPGGYQFVGRTIQMWNTWRTTKEFTGGHPWLLRFFDQIRFYPVTAAELLEMRDRFPHGKLELNITSERFRLNEYRAFLNTTAEAAAAFKRRQQDAFEAERDRWRANDLGGVIEAADEPSPREVRATPLGCRVLKSPAQGSVWHVAVQPGERVKQGQRLVIVESMKMEIAIAAPMDGTVAELLCNQGAPVMAGESLLFLALESA
jgi:urea carboxylase